MRKIINVSITIFICMLGVLSSNIHFSAEEKSTRSSLDTVSVSTETDLINELSDVDTITGATKTININSDIILSNTINVPLNKGKNIIITSDTNATLQSVSGKPHFTLQSGTNEVLISNLKLVGNIENVHISGDKLLDTVATATSGGGIRADNMIAKVTIENVEFKHIKARPITIDTNNQVYIKNSNFITNATTIEGAAIRASGTGDVFIQNSLFENNYARRNQEINYIGSTVFVGNTAINLTIENSAFINNKSHAAGTNAAAVGGGAIAFKQASGNLSVNHSYFYGNNVESPIGKNVANGTNTDGGAIYSWWSTGEIKIENSTFEENVAGDEGGAISLVCSPNTNNLISNNTFVGNRSRGQQVGISNGWGNDGVDGGGAIELNGASPTRSYATIENNTLYNNNAEAGKFIIGSSLNNGGGISFRDAEGILKNNIIVGNLAAGAQKNVYIDASTITSTNNVIDASVLDTFGTLTPTLTVNGNPHKAAGYDIKTLKIAPNNSSTALGVADGIAVSATTSDQRGVTRGTPADAGAIDILYVEYNANQGKWTGNANDVVYANDWYHKVAATGDITEKFNILNYNENTAVLSSGNPTRTNYTFLGWNTNKTALTPMSSSDITTYLTNVVENKALYAIWAPLTTYTVTYNGNGNTGGVVPTDNTNYNIGDTVTVESGVPIKTGHTFGGWLYNGVTYTDGDTFTMPATNITLVAIWTTTTTFTITYNGNGNDGGIVPTDTNTYNAGDIVTVESGVPTKNGYIFGGWFDGTNTYNAGDIFNMPNHDVELLAIWTPIVTYTVIYDGNGNDGGIVPIDTNLYGATDLVVVLSDEPIKNGYEFSGWEYNGNVYHAGDTFNLAAANAILTAVWTVEPKPTYYTVTYHGNGHTLGTEPVDTNLYQSGHIVPVATCSLEKDKHHFLGWSDGVTRTIHQPGDTFVMPANDVILTAIWEMHKEPTQPSIPDIPSTDDEIDDELVSTGENTKKSVSLGFILIIFGGIILLFSKKRQINTANN